MMLNDATSILIDAAQSGFQWTNLSGPLGKVIEEVGEVREAFEQDSGAHLQEELGDLLIASINVITFLGYAPQDILEQAYEKFNSRMLCFKTIIQSRGLDAAKMTFDERIAIWQEAKLNLATRDKIQKTV